MRQDNYTEQADWEKYWRNQEIVPFERIFFEEYLKYFPEKATLIEIGGFPGRFAGFFKKKFDFEVTIIDYVMADDIVRKVEKSYGIGDGSIKTIKADFFNYSKTVLYDIVLSVGFIEHFEDTSKVIKNHIELLKKNGILLITIPNFKGLNGLVQKYFDPQNYSNHNIKSMDIRLLKSILKNMDLKYYSVNYSGKPTIWIEPDAPIHPVTRYILLFLGKVIKRIPFRNNWFLAPHIIIFSKK